MTPHVSWRSVRRGEVVFCLLVAKPPAVDAPRGPEVTPMMDTLVESTTRSPLMIKVRRPAKTQSVQPSPVIAEVDAFPTHP